MGRSFLEYGTKEPNMVEKRKLINQKAAGFALRTEEVTLENKEEFEEIVGDVNQVKEGVR